MIIMDPNVKEDGPNIGGQDVIRLLMDVDDTDSADSISDHDETNDSHDDSQLLTIVTTTSSQMDTDESCVMQSSSTVDHPVDDDADSLSSRIGLLAEPTQLTAGDLGQVTVGGSFYQILPQAGLVGGDTSGAAVLQTVSVTEDNDGLQTITLSDGTVAVIQRGILEKGDTQDQAEQDDDDSLVPGLSISESFQAVQLGDGSTALLAPSALTADWSSLDPSRLTSQTESTTEVTKPAAATVSTSSLVTQGSSDMVPDGELKQSPHKTYVQASDMNSLGVNNRGGSEKNITMGDKAFQCKHLGCGRLYSTMHHLKVHERSHTGDKPFHCEFAGCNKSFATSYGLKSHKRVHTGEKPYKCPDEACVKAFKTSGDLQKHVRTHTGERPFKCPFEGCERAFTTSNIRKVHIRTHTGERPFICGEKGCGKAFSSATNYRNHIRIHTGEKPYVCTVQGCGKRFTEYSSLYKHHIVHTHTKPYVCNLCGKNYRQTSTLAMHRRMAHGEEIPNSDETMLGIVQHNVMVSHGEEGVPEKSGQLQLRLTGPTNLTRGSTANENTLVITTSQAAQTQVAMVHPDKLGMLGGATQVSSGDTATDVVSLLQHASALTVPVGELAGQQILVVTDPSQLDMLQLSQATSLKPAEASLPSPSTDVTSLTPTTGLTILGSSEDVKDDAKIAELTSD